MVERREIQQRKFLHFDLTVTFICWFCHAAYDYLQKDVNYIEQALEFSIVFGLPCLGQFTTKSEQKLLYARKRWIV